MLQFAIIGCGRISRRHAENIQRIGHLRAVCDIIPEKASELANEFGCKSYHTIEDLLLNEPDIHIVSVCTPNGFHAEHAIKSLQAGKHVLCEKPLCITAAAAWQLIETEKFCRRKLFVVKSNRYNPITRELKNLVQNQKLGKIYSFHLSCIWNRPPEYYHDWHGKLFPDGGTLYTQFSHYIDAIIWLFGDLRAAKGFKTNAAHQESIEFEDTGVATLAMKNGAIGSIHWSVNSFLSNHEIALTVVAEKGTIRVGGPYMNEVQYLVAEHDAVFETVRNASNHYNNYQGSMSNHNEVYDHLIKALEHSGDDFANAYDGLRTVEAIEKIYKSVSLI
ncbi:MAG: Gfo/Idh/MocA family oxidoreductase [Flavisolibacter sp.]|jgi:predicted dehydrogenase|nr:Gfo/Idh/MocA family oxidoreductase [Flavisolibacter sp.]